MKPCAAYHFTPQGPKAIPLPSKQVLRSLSEQQAAMFTPDGQSRMVVEMREKYRNWQLKPNSPPLSPAGSPFTSSPGAKA